MIATRPIPFLLSLPTPAGRGVSARRPDRSGWAAAEPRWIVLETFRPEPGCDRTENCAGCLLAGRCGSPRPAA